MAPRIWRTSFLYNFYGICFSGFLYRRKGWGGHPFYQDYKRLGWASLLSRLEKVGVGILFIKIKRRLRLLWNNGFQKKQFLNLNDGEKKKHR